jgi:hypothetical protein
LEIHAEQLKFIRQEISAEKGRKYSAPPEKKHEYHARKTHVI